MATPAQLSANRVNAQKSTGPKTEAGKVASSVNNRRDGFRGSFFFSPAEDPEEFYTMHAAYTEEWQPQTETETNLVQMLAENFWLRKRAQMKGMVSEARTDLDASAQMKLMELYGRYESKYERGFHKCLKELQAIKKQRQAEKSDEAALLSEPKTQTRAFERAEGKIVESARKEQLHYVRLRTAEAKLAKLELASNVQIAESESEAKRGTVNITSPNC